MNQKLTESLDKLPETLAPVKTQADLIGTVVGLERLVLKSNYEDRQSGSNPSFERREYMVGGPNTRGLSWKLVLCRTIADATFCKMQRTGVHGGGVVILGHPENVDTTIKLFEALVPVYENLSQTAYTEFADSPKEEGTPSVNKSGWTNQWLIAAPETLAAELNESRAKDASSTNKIATMIAEANESLAEYQKSLAPVKEPKAPKAPREKKKKKTDVEASGDPNAPEPESENEADVNQPEEPEGETPTTT